MLLTDTAIRNAKAKDNLLDEIEARMQQQIKAKELFRIHWKPV